MILKLVEQYIQENRLLSPGDKVLVAVSGGADSVALLCILQAAGYICEAAHCNFHLRGTESDRDEQFVRQLCDERGIPLHIAHFDTTRYAAEKHISIEMAARELRYEWFEKVRITCGAVAIAVAHHRDDSVETQLLNLIRGTGITGLLGIRPCNGNIIRPLLCIGREDIVRYLQGIGQAYVTDSTNLEDEYTRNKIRLHLLPLMQSINPSISNSLMEMGKRLADVSILYNKGIAEAKARILTTEGISIDKLMNEAVPNTLLFEILHPLGFTSSQVGDIIHSLHGQPGKRFESKEWRVVKDREYLLIEPLRNQEADTFPFQLIKEERSYTPDFSIPREKNAACFDADKLRGKIYCRKWQIGDTFVPFGMKGRKKVSDYLTDRKFSISQKEQQWVLCCGKHIVWLIGERTDNRFRVDETTRKVVVYKIDKQSRN